MCLLPGDVWWVLTWRENELAQPIVMWSDGEIGVPRLYLLLCLLRLKHVLKRVLSCVLKQGKILCFQHGGFNGLGLKLWAKLKTSENVFHIFLALLHRLETRLTKYYLSFKMSLSYFNNVIVYYFPVLLMLKLSGAGRHNDPIWKDSEKLDGNRARCRQCHIWETITRPKQMSTHHLNKSKFRLLRCQLLNLMLKHSTTMSVVSSLPIMYSFRQWSYLISSQS